MILRSAHLTSMLNHQASKQMQYRDKRRIVFTQIFDSIEWSEDHIASTCLSTMHPDGMSQLSEHAEPILLSHHCHRLILLGIIAKEVAFQIRDGHSGECRSFPLYSLLRQKSNLP